jgi:hypothetical protein
MRYLSMSQLSQVTGKDRRTVKDRLQGLEPKLEGRAHLYDAHIALPMILELTDGDNSVAKQMADEQLRYERERADKVALQNQKLRGEVVSIEEVANVVEGEYAAVKAALIAIPSKCAGELATMDNVIEIKKLLDGLINETLVELSSSDRLDLSQVEAGPDAEPND